MNRPEDGGPLVSVVIPTHGRGELLRRAIDSVLAQSVADLELIVVDDATPGREVADVVAGCDDPRLCCLRHEVNRGAPAARNTGIRAARGRYVALLDSDDEWLPNKLALQLERFERDETGQLGVVVCNVALVTRGADGATRSRNGSARAFFGDVYYTLLGRRDMRPTSTLLIRRTLLGNEHLFDENLESSQEYDLLLRLSRRCRFDTVQQVLVRMYLHAGARISTSDRRMPGMEQTLLKHLDELQACPPAMASHHSVLALRYCKPDLLDMAKARAHLRAAIRATPWAPGPWTWYLASLFGPELFRRVRFAWPKNLLFGAWHRLECR